jgi:Arc/MetJ-type ribon-helix-helix transcriptional regulator
MTSEKMISFRPDEDTEKALQEIIYYLQTQTLGKYVNRSDAIRYAVELTAIGIRQEQPGKEA